MKILKTVKLVTMVSFAVASAWVVGARQANAQTDIIQLGLGEMVDHPAGAHSVVWNGPAFLDVGVPAGGIVRIAVANLPPQWTLLRDAQGQPLPIAARYDRSGLTIRWLPYDGPGRRPTPQFGGGPSGADSDAAAVGDVQHHLDVLRQLDGFSRNMYGK